MNRMIVAVNPDYVIGLDGKIPWKYKGDFKRFKEVTMGGALIMGRKTWESIGRPLPGRKNIIVSTTMEEAPEGTEVFDNLPEALNAYGDERDNWIIGGARLYEQGLGFVEEIDVTYVPDSVTEEEYKRAVRFPLEDLLKVHTKFQALPCVDHEYEPTLQRRIYTKVG